MSTVSEEELELLRTLKSIGAISDNRLYRMRLFNSRERRSILHALPNSAAGMLDELEMVNFDVHGQDATQIRRNHALN